MNSVGLVSHNASFYLVLNINKTHMSNRAANEADQNEVCSWKHI